MGIPFEPLTDGIPVNLKDRGELVEGKALFTEQDRLRPHPGSPVGIGFIGLFEAKALFIG
jgi:hypothetical protein